MKVLYENCDLRVVQESDGVYIHTLSLGKIRAMVRIKSRAEADSMIAALEHAEFK